MEQDIGLIGLAVMGQNLVLNMNDHGFRVSVYNRTSSKVDEFRKRLAATTMIIGFSDLQQFFQSLKRPRRVMFMVKAGQAIDELLELSFPFLESGDIIIDGGNSYFTDTVRRQKYVEEKGLYYLGVGISGGEEGARYGPSIMPGGSAAAWPYVKPIFQAISAKVDGSSTLQQHECCCDWVGDGGAGHFVKMVHNGIEYGDMQLIAEIYDVLRRGADCTNSELQDIFTNWNTGKLESYLIEITAKIFAKKDDQQPAHTEYLIDSILDVAGQKGTGKWTAVTSLGVEAPLTLITEAVFCRYVSSMAEERAHASKILSSGVQKINIEKPKLIEIAQNALYAAKIISYAQGFMLMLKAAQEYNWKLNMGSCALMWRGGCIIRSAFLGKIKEAFEKNPTLESLILDPYFAKEIQSCLADWRRLVSEAALCGIPVPCLMSALSFYDSLRSDKLPTNLTQAQRDFFGAHTFERIDKSRGQFYHADWHV